MKKKHKTFLIPIERVEQQIYLMHGVRVMLDSDLARLYQVHTFRLNEAVKRNRHRFPADFMFQLSKKEFDGLISQFAMSKDNKGGRRSLPYAFTEHGVAMLSSVLKNKGGVQMNILIIRAFVKLRQMLANHKDPSARMEELEAVQKRHTSIISLLAEEIDKIEMLPPESPKESIGFAADK
jgi:hypothetical protein